MVRLRKLITVIIMLLFVLSSCNFPVQPAPAGTGSTEQVVTETPLPEEPPATATVAPAPITPVDYSTAVYLDDRSTPASLVFSFANAINRYEITRAEAYWMNPVDSGSSLGTFSLQNGDVASVQVTMGDIYSDGAAGSVYFTVPALFVWTLQDSSVQRSSACLLLRLTQPGNYGAPPITPMNIDRGSFTLIDDSVSTADGLAGACAGVDYAVTTSGNPPVSQEMEVLADLSMNNYIDNRSGALEVVSSLFNAINRKEYVRAYSYWQEAPADYEAYANGFSDTDTISAVFGEVTSDAGAGQWYYQIPVAQIVQTTGADTQTYVGCYTLHLSNPGMQASQPFEPLGIKDGHFELVPNGSDLAPLLAAACSN